MQKKMPQNVNKILYIVIVAALCVTAIVIGITAAANRGSKTPVPTDPPVTNAPITADTPTEDPLPITNDPAPVVKDTLPTFLAPAVGVVAKTHDESVAVYSLTMNDWRVHTGIDIACAVGDEVLAAADGTVESVYADPMMGNTVVLSHAGEGKTVYKNLDATLPEGLEVGQTVKVGQVIGAVGDTAIIESADEPHLHFEMQVKGAAVDPLEYISAESREACLRMDESFES